jgi:hypothetical protein
MAGMSLSKELERIWKAAVYHNLRECSYILLGGSEKNYEPPRDCSRSWDRSLKPEVLE